MIDRNLPTPRAAGLAVLAVAAFAFVLFVQGAIPFFTTPSVNQAFWTVGFSQSFANQSIFSVYANNFGAPGPAAMAFGLAGAWPMALLICLGLYPADAYTAIVALWFGAAFFSAYKFGRIFGCSQIFAILGAVLWLTMPIVWGHGSGYGMLSVGIALLALYFLAAWNLLLAHPTSQRPSAGSVAFYASAAVIAVFMDGYTFVMFAVGSSLLLAYVILSFPDLRRRTITFVIPVELLSFAAAYLLYALFVGKLEYEREPIDMFRGWGLDLTFIAVPTRGVHWLMDVLGLSIERTVKPYFGDNSVWETTFCLPILVAGLISWWQLRRNTKAATGLLLVAAFGFYMAFGPSLKFNSTKPASMQSAPSLTQTMPANLAIMPTGNAWLSEHVPGFDVMRASYRWSALAIFCLWMLFLLFVGRRHPKGDILTTLTLVGLIAINLPDPSFKWARDTANREMFFIVDRELVAPLSERLRPNELVAWLPYGNDFMINYLSSRLRIRTYNIGGDKNLRQAQRKWPAEMIEFNAETQESRAKTVLQILAASDADAIVIPYYDPNSSASAWPCVAETTMIFNEFPKVFLFRRSRFRVPRQR